MIDSPHRRFNPLTGEWVLVSPHRAKRPWVGQLERTSPANLPHYDPTCYLCPRNERAGGIRNPDYAGTFVFEIGVRNDYSYLDTPAHERDSRWVHRPRADWDKYDRRDDKAAIEGQVYRGLQTLIALRKKNDVFSGGELEIISTENEHVLGFMKIRAEKRAVIFANFSDQPQRVPARVFDQHSVWTKKQLHGARIVPSANEIVIEPLEFLVFG